MFDVQCSFFRMDSAYSMLECKLFVCSGNVCEVAANVTLYADLPPSEADSTSL